MPFSHGVSKILSAIGKSAGFGFTKDTNDLLEDPIQTILQRIILVRSVLKIEGSTSWNLCLGPTERECVPLSPFQANYIVLP
jgi:hypothetical protein